VGVPEEILVEPLRKEFLEDAIRIHRAGLGYSMNSRLGNSHLAHLYLMMGNDPECYVGVAVLHGRPVGVISGTEDANRLKSRMLRAMPLTRLIVTAARFLYQPWLILQWITEAIIAAPVIYEGQEVKAVLTAIATAPAFQGRGIGRRLVEDLERFFVGRGVHCFRLDTLTTNEGARAFYSKLGFIDVGVRADSQIFVKKIPA
jgi:GNAT superfamily N-acetyltransferase